jgi:hypothetical protein
MDGTYRMQAADQKDAGFITGAADGTDRGPTWEI